MSLEIKGLSVQASGKDVVTNVSFSLDPGKVTAILGSNGAGKSELVLGIAGVMPISAGTVLIEGSDITGKSPDIVRSSGVAAVPEGHKVLTQLSVDENLRAAGSLRWADLEENLRKTYERFPELAERKGQLAGTLSGGQQQMVALGHALMSAPNYLIIDEMSLGLAPLIVKRLFRVVEELQAQGVGIVLIEQFTDLALNLAGHAIVLRSGRCQYSGSAKTLLANPDLLDEAYFGAGHHRAGTAIGA
ncbi:ABC transporter ATP-binding protein [Planktotalea sp.]|uniref:ABC transporter ATP-binding protein n=1 Tax=Planktotalea sp. TaxID=2029877 RepID=UPI003D6B4BC9